MSGLFNLKVNNVAAEDITLNGQTVEEVWVDGVQVFDAYDPTTIPDGTLALRSSTWFDSHRKPEEYSTSERTENLNGQMGKKGSVLLSVFSPSVALMDGASLAMSAWSQQGFAKVSRCWLRSPLFTLFVTATADSVSDAISKGDAAQYDLTGVSDSSGATIRDGSEGHTGGGWIKYRWDFEQRKCWVSYDSHTSEIEYNLTKKWTPNMTVSATMSWNYTAKVTSGDYEAYRVWVAAAHSLEISNT